MSPHRAHDHLQTANALIAKHPCLGPIADAIRDLAAQTPPMDVEQCHAHLAQRQVAVIGIHGRKRSGKDTLASLMSAAHAARAQASNRPTQQVRRIFAGPFKQICEQVYPAIPLDVWHGEDAVREQPRDDLDGLSGRQVLQYAGTELGRLLHRKSLWVDAWAHDILQTDWKPHALITVPDVRMPNEPDLLRSVGGQVLRIVRPDLPAPTDSHVSERQLPPGVCDALIINRDLAGLRRVADFLAASVLDAMPLLQDGGPLVVQRDAEV
jgi:hypothetical protein